MKKILSEQQFLSIAEVNKIPLSAFDNKRFYDDEGIHYLAFGHLKIGQKRNGSKDFLQLILQDVAVHPSR